MNNNAVRPTSDSNLDFQNNPPATWRDRARSYKQELLTYGAAAQCTHAPAAIKFCVFTSGRTGSTLFFDLANTHPQIQCEGHAKLTELLNAPFLWPRRYVEARAKLCPAPVYGFKLQLHHLTRRNPTDPVRFIQGMHESGWKVIYLSRRNTFRRGLSKYIAQETRTWHSVRDSDGQVRTWEKTPVKAKVKVDTKLLLHCLNQVTDSLVSTDQVMSKIPHWKLEYEDDLIAPAQQAQAMNRFFGWLDLPPHAVSTSFMRTSSDDWREKIENAEEVAAALLGTRFEEFLESP